jgi:hypothetical protein
MVDVDNHIAPMTILIRSLTELSVVFFQLCCFSRLGANDYYYVVDNSTGVSNAVNRNEPSLAANLVLFVSLVVFQFPFLNGYILLMYDMCVIGRTNIWRFLCCCFLVGVQLLAVVLAHLCILSVQNSQQPWKGRITWMAPKQVASDEGRNGASEFVEEFVTVTALIVGYVHLTYFNFQYDKKPEAQLFRSNTHFFSEIEGVAQKLPIPLPFIMQVTLLVNGLLRAFPTVHLSPHVSLYVALMGYTTWGAFGYRIGGGAAAFIVAYGMFWGFYTWRTGVHEGKTLLCWHADPEEHQEDDSPFSSDVLTEGTNPTNPLLRSESIRINAVRDRAELVRSDSMRSNASRGPPELVRDHNPARPETPATRHQSISFNNTYRHVYRAI